MLIEDNLPKVSSLALKDLGYGRFFIDGLGHVCVKVKHKFKSEDVPKNACLVLDCQTDEVSFFSDVYTITPIDAKLIRL